MDAHRNDHVDGVPEDVESDAFPSDMTYATYNAWTAEALWQHDTEALLQEDFNLDSIPSIELGFSKYDQEMHLAAANSDLPQEGGDYDQTIDFPFPSEEPDFDDDATPGPQSDHDRRPGLFGYENLGMNW